MGRAPRGQGLQVGRVPQRAGPQVGKDRLLHLHLAILPPLRVPMRTAMLRQTPRQAQLSLRLFPSSGPPLGTRILSTPQLHLKMCCVVST